jgi:hypothetical protein
VVTYRVDRQYHIPQSSQSHLIDEIIEPALVNPGDTWYVNAFVPLLFYILPLRLLIGVWPNRDPIVCGLRLVSSDLLTDAVSLSMVCEPDVVDRKDCFELALRIFGGTP